MNAGSQFDVSTGSASVFLANVSGTSFFTGGGTKIFLCGSSSITGVSGTGATIVESGSHLNVSHVRDHSLEVRGTIKAIPDGTSTGASRVATILVDGQLD